MTTLFRKILRFVRHCQENDSIGIAAKTAFFFLLSIFPLCMLASWALGYFHLNIDVLEGFLPRNMLDAVPDFSQQSVPANPLLILTTLWAASNAVWALMKGVSHAQVGASRPFRARFMAVAFTLCFLAVIALTLAILAVSPWLNLSIVGGAIFLLLFALYRYTPGAHITARRAALTAAIAAAAWILVSWGFEAYLRYFSNYETLYGSFGVFLGLCLWVFVICCIIIFGAEASAEI